jgi:hypothetical protein
MNQQLQILSTAQGENKRSEPTGTAVEKHTAENTMEIVDQHEWDACALIGATIGSRLLGKYVSVQFDTGTTVQKMQDDLDDPKSELRNYLAKAFGDTGWDSDGHYVALEFDAAGCFVPLDEIEEEVDELCFNRRYYVRSIVFEDETTEWNIRLAMNPTLIQVYHDVVIAANDSDEVQSGYRDLRDLDTRDRWGGGVKNAIRILIAEQLGLDEPGE